MRWVQRVALPGVVASVVAGAAVAGSPEESRYPYDPACPWGRVANGKGMLVRCLEEREARLVLGAASARPPQSAAAHSASSSSPPAGSAPPATSSSAPADPPPPDPPSAVRVATLTVTADQGGLPAAERHLRGARKVFARCVEQHGGVEGASAEISLRFLVRARGRAEGVSVARRRGLRAEAARCIAEALDRRWVGQPEEPITGATLVLGFARDR
ncbi:MAG: hypothetical protein IT376_11105 [Polyangiaceae bacterium]|nr:hypothetical protein [Polyangiaceae bacterium]